MSKPSAIYQEKVNQYANLLQNVVFTNRDGKTMDIEQGFLQAIGTLAEAGVHKHRIFVIGNGGSAAIASHVVNDLVNNGKLTAFTLHDSSLMTCMANDYGYDKAYSRMLETMAQKDDVLIGISSSGNSANIRNGAATMARKGGHVITLSGFNAENPLRAMGDLNMWLDSEDYGFVEVGHQFLLHHLCDRIKDSIDE